MKRLLLILFCAIISTFSFLKAQTCQPDHTGYTSVPDTGIILPDSFPHATVGVSGSLVVTIGIPSHRYYKPLGQDIKINWIRFNSLKNAPAGMKMLDNNGGTNYPQMNKGTWNCMIFEWTPAKAGKYVIDFSVDANVILLILPVTETDQTVGHFTVIVDDNVGIDDNQNLNSISFICNPNPFEDKAIITYYSEQNCKSEFKIYSLTGQLIYSKTLNTFSGKNEFIFSAADIKKGIYLSSMKSDAGTAYQKIVKY